MLKLISFITIFFIMVSCSNNKPEWTKESFYEDCIINSVNNADIDSIIGKKNAYKFCRCMTDNVFRIYKTEKEMEKDEDGFSQLIYLCFEKIEAEIKKKEAE